MKQELFGTTPAGDNIYIFTLSNQNGCEARIINYGGILVSLSVPDRFGNIEDVVLGFDSLEPYLGDHPCFGALIGRYGNRIAAGSFSLDDATYTLVQNQNGNHLHGGLKGFDKVIWQSIPMEHMSREALQLSYLSKDGEEGYPGELSVQVIYTLTPDNALEIDYWARTTAPTVLNLTHHSYFNLAGKGDVLNHELMINADHFTPTDSTSIPTGEIRKVLGTPMDFTSPKLIGTDLHAEDEQIRIGSGYDHNFVLNKEEGETGASLAAKVYEPQSGRILEVFTTEPGVQLYTANHVHDIVGKGGVNYGPHSGFCLETQHFPDSPNHPHFPSTVLRPGETYHQMTSHKFSVDL